MNKSFALFNLREALEEIDQTVKDLEAEPEYSEAELSVAMMHLYHPLTQHGMLEIQP